MSSKSSVPGSPIPDLAYDVITLIHEKAKGLEAYEKYMEDAAEDTELSQLLETLREQDEQCVQDLRSHLVRLLEQGGDSDVDMESDEDDEDSETATSKSTVQAKRGNKMK